MTREEARKQLEGTWSFQMSGSAVLVHEESLLNEISLLAGAARKLRGHINKRKVVPYETPLYAAGR